MHGRAPASAAPSDTPSTGPVIRGAVVAALGGLLFGFDSAVISGTTDALARRFALDANALGFTVAVALIGTFIGSVVVSRPADSLGRKRTLNVLAVLYLASAIGCFAAVDWYTLLAARVIGGLAIGGSSVVAPLYTAEIAPPRLRGRLVGITQLNIVVGILLSYVSNWLIARVVDPDVAWRWMLGVPALPSLAFLLLGLGISESPRWLIERGRDVEARSVLRRLGVQDVDGELAAIRAALASERGPGDRLFQARHAQAVFLAWAIAMFNQLSGINALIYYAPKIFSLAGAGTDSALRQSILIGLTNLVAVVGALAVIDKVGRRPLIIAGSVGTALCLAAVAWAFSAGAAQHSSLLLVGLVGFIACFSASQGAVIWVFLSEIFPTSVRAKGQALGSFTHWFMAAAVSWGFPLVAERSPATAFTVFASFMGLQLLFGWKLMPETKGRSLEELGQHLHGRPSSRGG